VNPGDQKAVLAALFANAGIAVAKFVGFLATGAASMQAEAVHSLADSGNQALLLWGSVAARKEADEERPFGYGQERYFWSFVVALVLFALGAVFAMVEGIEKLRHPHEVTSPGWAIGILVLGLALEGFSFRTAVRAARPKLRGRGWWRFVRETKTPELPVVLLEDLGALLGLTMALAGVSLAAATGDGRFDAAGSIAIGALLGVIAVVLAIEMRSLLIGEGTSHEVSVRLREALAAGEDVRNVIHMRTLYLGPDEILVGAKVEFDGGLDFAGLSDGIDAAEARLRAAAPVERVVVYLEPDVYEPPAAG